MFLKFQLIRTEVVLNVNNEEYNQDDYNDIRTKLNDTKSKLDIIPSEIYRKISSELDYYTTLKHYLRKHFNLQIVTNATLKLYEILEQFPFIRKNTNTFNVFCNAELPGGFIVAINHYIKTKHPIVEFDWIANSYLSDNTLSDIYEIYKKNKNKWLMNDTMNGDITSVDNIMYIKDTVKSIFRKGIDLYTSDIGIDVSSDYNSQEEQTLLLNYCQVLCGLLTLRTKGCMVTKQFTYFTSFNTSLLILLSSLFKQVYITKPATSRPFNSEIYVVCIDYIGMSDNMSNYLLSRVTNVQPNVPLVLYQTPSYLQLIAHIIYSQQIEEIEKLISMYNNSQKLSITSKDKQQKQDEWVKMNKILVIKSSDHIPYKK